MEIFKRRKPIISIIHFYNLSKIHTTDGFHGYSVYQTVAYLVLHQKRGQYAGASRKLSTEIYERRKPFIPCDLHVLHGLLCTFTLPVCTWTNSLVNCCLRIIEAKTRSI